MKLISLFEKISYLCPQTTAFNMKHRILTLILILMAATFTTEANPVDMNTAREVAMKFVNANTKTHLRGAD